MSKGNDDEFPFNDLFGSVEQIFREFDRMFFGFAFPNEEFSSSSSSSSTSSFSSSSLRDEVLKENQQFDENLDDEISEYFPSRKSSSIKTHVERRPTSSGKCFIEKQIEEISNGNDQTIKETTTKVCGENHHTTIKINGQIQREFGNSTIEDLDRIDSSSDSTKFTQTYSDLFKKLFS